MPGRQREGLASTLWLPLSTGAVVAGAALAYCFSFPDPWALRGENGTSLFPMAADAWRQWTSGHFPGWTTAIFGGFPLFSGAQSAALYLPHALAFASTPEPHWRAMDVALALHAGLLAAGCTRLLLRLGARPIAALLGAAVCLSAPQIVYWTNFVPIYASLAWWPWLFLAADRLGLERRLPLSALFLGSIALAAQVFVGFFEFALYSGCIAAAFALASPRDVPVFAKFVRIAFLAVSAGMLAAPQLLTTALELDAGNRTLDAVQVALGGAPSIRAVVDPFGPLPARGLFSVFLGAGTLGLAVLAIVRRARRSAFLLGLSVVAMVFAMGEATPLYGWLTALPPFSYFRNPIKLIAAAEMAIALLAALGLEMLLRDGVRDRRAFVAALVLGAFALGEHAMHLRRLLPLVAQPHVQGALTVPRDLAGFETLLPELRRVDPQTGLPHRMVEIDGAPLGSLPQVHGVDSALGALPALTSPRQRELLRPLVGEAWLGLRRADPAWLDLFAVDRVVAARDCEALARPTLRVVQSAPGSCLLANDASPARIELLDRVRIVADEQQELSSLVEHPDRAVPVVYAAPPPSDRPPAWKRPGPLAPDEGVRVLSYRPGEARIHVTSRAHRLVLVRETRNRGWQAHLDGEAAEILPAAGLFFAVAVGPGESVLDLRHHPRGLRAGFALQAIFLVGAGALVVIRLRRSASRGVSSASPA